MHARNLVRGAALVLATSMLGCAGQSSVPETPSPPESEAPVGSDAPPPPAAPEPYRARSADVAPGEASSPALGARQTDSQEGKPRGFDSLTGSLSPHFQTSMEDFLVAELALSRASAACSDACRALRSMVRAAEQMCAIAASEPEEYRCQVARDRVRGARDHVRRACRTCPQGPLLEEPD